MHAKDIQGFKAIPLYFSKDSTSFHELFLKEHSTHHQEENKPPGRTLFILNIPPYITEDILKMLFSPAGKILTVILKENVNFHTAYVVFAKRDGLLKATQINTLILDQLSLKTGLDKWMDDYNSSVEDPGMLSKEINNFMLNYDKAEKESKQGNQEVDDEGWTVVTKKGRNPGVANKESVNLKINQKMSRAKKRKELTNFYTFQIKESKQKNLALLRKNFEDAKKKVNFMKASRKFRPY